MYILSIMTFVKCSRCHSEVLEEFFSRNQKGVLHKCCDNCLKRFRCEQCEYRASHKHHLKMHVKQVHDKIKDVKCDIDQCEYVCSHKHHLKMHAKQVHDKIKDVKCDQCEYVCSLKHHLKMHVKQVHDRVMDVKCNQCDYTCSRAETLRRHTKTCTGKIHCSQGEYEIMCVLNDLKVEYLFNKSFEVKHKKWLRWDFRITIKGRPCFIEFDGAQHVRAAWGGEEGLQLDQKRDGIKDKYCEDKGHPLLRISHNEHEIKGVVLD